MSASDSRDALCAWPLRVVAAAVASIAAFGLMVTPARAVTGPLSYSSASGAPLADE